jgi:Flp pilus assembly pilin Flp
VSRRLSRRGQAMVEYSIITHFLLIGGTVLLLPVITKLYEGLSTYFESIYFVLRTAAI